MSSTSPPPSSEDEAEPSTSASKAKEPLDSHGGSAPKPPVDVGVASLLAVDAQKSTSVIELRVRFGETDLMGIVHHGSYLLYFEVGRVEWLRSRGVTYADWASRGVHLPVVEAHLNYQAPARFDDLLVVETTLTHLRTVSMKFAYRIHRVGRNEQQGQEQRTKIAEGWTRLGCIDNAHKLLKIPEYMRDVLLAGETRTQPAALQAP